MYRTIERQGDQLRSLTEHNTLTEAQDYAVHLIRERRKQRRATALEIERGNDLFGFYTVAEYATKG